MKVLDHGYVDLVEPWGSDESIISAARMSTQGSFRGWDQDAKLLKFLYTNGHMTPFEMAGVVIEVQAPIFVFREWHRHRTQSYNEASARYAPMPEIFYVPTEERLLASGGSNKQAQGLAGAEILTEDGATEAQALIRVSYERACSTYQTLLSNGVSKELARVVLPVGMYSKMRASANLRNWLAFLTLREDPKAQWEIQEYARAVHTILKKLFPRTLALYEEKS